MFGSKKSGKGKRPGKRGNNFLKNIRLGFKTPREAIEGIGRPPGQMDPKAFLLQKFNMIAQERIKTGLAAGIDALKLVLSKGLTKAARRFNTEQKYKHLRLQTMPI